MSSCCCRSKQHPPPKPKPVGARARRAKRLCGSREEGRCCRERNPRAGTAKPRVGDTCGTPHLLSSRPLGFLACLGKSGQIQQDAEFLTFHQGWCTSHFFYLHKNLLSLGGAKWHIRHSSVANRLTVPPGSLPHLTLCFCLPLADCIFSQPTSTLCPNRKGKASLL